MKRYWELVAGREGRGVDFLQGCRAWKSPHWAVDGPRAIEATLNRLGFFFFFKSHEVGRGKYRALVWALDLREFPT